MKKIEKVMFGIGGAMFLAGAIGLYAGINMAKKRGRL